MSNILITLTKTATPLPTGVVFDHTNVVVVDSAATSQTFALNGSETPPWSQVVTVADGAGTVTATDVDSTGATIGTPVTQAFTSTAPTFAATTGITVSQA